MAPPNVNEQRNEWIKKPIKRHRAGVKNRIARVKAYIHWLNKQDASKKPLVKEILELECKVSRLNKKNRSPEDQVFKVITESTEDNQKQIFKLVKLIPANIAPTRKQTESVDLTENIDNAEPSTKSLEV